MVYRQSPSFKTAVNIIVFRVSVQFTVHASSLPEANRHNQPLAHGAKCLFLCVLRFLFGGGMKRHLLGEGSTFGSAGSFQQFRACCEPKRQAFGAGNKCFVFRMLAPYYSAGKCHSCRTWCFSQDDRMHAHGSDSRQRG